MRELRLGDIIDDFCVKCRRLTNHAIVSLMNGAAAKVRCRTCYSDHDYRNEIAPPTKKELLKQKELYEAVLAGVVPVEAVVESEADVTEAPKDEGSTAAAAAAVAPALKKKKAKG
jgi:hypothetical protein